MRHSGYDGSSAFNGPADSYSGAVDELVAFSGQGQDFFLRAKAESLVGLVHSHFDGGEALSLLDVGCGHGLMHPHLVEGLGTDAHLFGADIEQKALEHAAEANPEVEYVAYDGYSLPYSNGEFSVVFAVCVMHHVPPAQWPQFLSELRRVVKPGGLVCIFEHNPLNPLTMRVVNRCPHDANAVLLKAAEMRAIFAKAGLDSIKQRYILFTPFSARFWRWLDSRLAWCPLGAQYYVFGTVPQ